MDESRPYPGNSPSRLPDFPTSRLEGLMAKVSMPQLGESVTEGTIGRWLKQPGEAVEKYEPLVEVTTDKVNAEVPSPFAGVLREITAQEGETVNVGTQIAVIAAEGEAAEAGG